MNNTPQDKLERMSDHFEDVGLYTKANYCLEIAEYISKLEDTNRTVAFGFFEEKYPSLCSVEDARSEVLEPVNISQVINMFNKMAEALTLAERKIEALETANIWRKNSENHDDPCKTR